MLQPILPSSKGLPGDHLFPLLGKPLGPQKAVTVGHKGQNKQVEPKNGLNPLKSMCISPDSIASVPH